MTSGFTTTFLNSEPAPCGAVAGKTGAITLAWLTGAVLHLQSGLALAEDTASTSVYLQTPGVMYFLKLSLTLAVVLGVFMLFAGIVRRMNGASANSRGPIKIVAGLTIGNRERLLIVKAGDAQLLLGVSASGIEKLHQFDEDIESIATEAGQSLSPFNEKFQHILSGLQK